MKSIIVRLKIIIIITLSIIDLNAQNINTKSISDGIYLVERSGNNYSELLPLTKNEKIITFNTLFIEKTEQDVKYLVINISDFVPLRLKEKPISEEQEDNRKNLLLSLNYEAKNQLTFFTSKNLNKLVSIVVRGEALTQHKIKAVIESGNLQITRCNDNACEFLYFELENNVEK